MNSSLTPILMTLEVNKTRDFYQNVLGFEYQMGINTEFKDVDNSDSTEELIWASMKSGGFSIMIQSRDSMIEDIPVFARQTIGASVSFYIDSKDVKGLYDRIKDKVPVVLAPIDRFYGRREFAISDPNGYILTFAENIGETHAA
ncbi:VOC family protein [Marinicella sp. W31]|uniref:VOC family protein n=1 Tax=Marinicella sp. W31 TaxID=3023713 RepID=UPI00375682FA